MVPSLGAPPPRHRHYYEVIAGSDSSSETNSPDPSFSTNSTSSLSSASNTNFVCAPHSNALQQQDAFTIPYHSQTPATSCLPRHNPGHSTPLPTDTPKQQQTTPSDSHAVSDSRFDSLHDLLERAGYKETRVVTPDRHTLAGMFAKKLATPPRKPRLVDDFSSDSPSLAASELRRAMQKSSVGRSSPPAITGKSKSLPSRNYKLPATADAPVVPPLPSVPTPSSGWFSSIWLFGPGTIISDPPAAVAIESQGTDTPQSDVRQDEDLADASITAAPATPSSPSASALTSASTSATFARSSPLKSKRTASNNQVWTASVAYRSNKSRTAPVRKSAGIASSSFDLRSNDAAAEEEWKALQKGNSNGASRRRAGLVDAFTSPTKKPSSSNDHNPQDSPGRQRKWRQERAAWRESLGDLQAMMDQSRMRREAAVATAARAEAASATTTASGEAATPDLAETSSTTPLYASKQSDNDAMAKLLSGPALPFLSTDPAVAPRNGSCTRPTHLSMRRMKSVEVLSKIMRERSTITSRAPATSADTQASVELDAEAGQISPTIKKRSTPPRLTVSSPRGISSPKELALEGQEFEPFSWSPGKAGGALIISNRRVQKKPRSKLRHVSSGSDLRSAAAEDGLKMPKRRGRSKSRGLPDTSPSKKAATSGPIESLPHQSGGSLSHQSKVQVLRSNVHVYDNAGREREEHASRVDDSPTLRRSKSSTHAPLVLAGGQEAGDVFFRPSPAPTPSGGGVLKKKDFSAKITRTSKIMRLIEEAENIPSIASLISQAQVQPQVSSRGRAPLGNVEAAPQAIAVQVHQRCGDRQGHEKGERLSSSLSRKSRDRMHTITRVLGQRYPTN